MKRIFKCLSVILTLTITIFAFSAITWAQTTEQDGLQVKLATDKADYVLNEDIKITISVTNTNDFTVKNVSIEALLPDNFKLKDSSQTTTEEVDIPAGETIILSVIAFVEDETQSTVEPTTKASETDTTATTTTEMPTTTQVETGTNNIVTTIQTETSNQNDTSTTQTETTTESSKSSVLNVQETTTSNQTTTKTSKNSVNTKKGKSPLTGIDYTILSVMFILFFLSLSILLYCLITHMNKRKKIISSVLCIVIVVSSLVGFNSYKIFAENKVDNVSIIDIKEKVKVNNQEYTIIANIKYVSNEINLTIDNKENKVTDFNQILTGTFSSSVNIVSVTYQIETEIDNYEVTSSGNAVINNNTYSANIQLKPELNRITVTATTENNKTESKTFDITYNSGKTYELNESHIAYDNKTNTKYVDNIILILFEEDVPDIRRQEIVSSINGKVVGSTNGINQWQVEISSRSLEDLENICADLEKNDDVYGAFVDKIVNLSTDIVSVNDPWENASNGNWYLDAIEAWSAWDYNERFSQINIGIVDNGFDTQHEDLSGKIYFPNKRCEINNNSEMHGTHVAGTIGANANNNKGITGLLWKSKLYCVDWSPSKNQEWDTISEALSGLTYTVEAGAKIVNYSLGMTSSCTYDECIKNLYDTNSIYASKVMVELLNKNKDFLIVQSAGNGTSDGYAVDAKYNGLFCSITSDDITIPKNSKISKQDILDRIIIVGNAEKKDNGTYQQHISSNGGERVDICAPGTDIFSTIPGGDFGSYGCSTGTSMSAPIVTAVCGMVWSLNNKLTGVEVKKIVCNSYDKNIWVWDNPSEKHITQNNYRMVNARLAVEQVFKGNISGSVKEASDKTTPIKGIEVQAINSSDTIVDVVTTNENGNFTLSLPEGKYKLNIGGEANSYLYENYTTDISVEPNVLIVLKDDILLKKINFGITGNVFDSKTKEPLLDVEVKAYKDNNGTKTYITKATTDNNGKYSLGVENSGIYSIEFNKTGYTTSTQDNILTSGKLTYAENEYLESDDTGGNTTFAGGDGTEENPYKVATPEQLDAVRNDLTAHYIQINDIDMSDWGNWEPIRSVDAVGDSVAFYNWNFDIYFSGTYNGNNYSIKNLKIINNDIDFEKVCFGLFAGLNNAIVKNVVLDNISYKIDKETTNYHSFYLENNEEAVSLFVGGIAGCCYSSKISTIEKCTVNGEIEVVNCSNAYVGGIAGVGDTINETNSIINIYVNANKDSDNENDSSVCCGGITGTTATINSKISSCKNNGNINATAGRVISCGGISGEDGYITNCCNYGDILGIVTNSLGIARNLATYIFPGGNSNVGGIVGATMSDGTSYCINYGNIKAQSISIRYTSNPFGDDNKSFAGGIVGWCGFDNSGSISDNYNCCNSVTSIANSSENSNIPSYAYAGRVAGYSREITNCYSINTTTLNGSIPTENIATNDINGQSLTKEEIEEKIKNLN